MSTIEKRRFTNALSRVNQPSTSVPLVPSIIASSVERAEESSHSNMDQIPKRHIDNEVIESTTYRGALELASSYVPQGTCKEEVLKLKSEIQHLEFILDGCKKFLDSNIIQNDILNRDERLALALYTFDLGNKDVAKENFYYKLNEVLRLRNNEMMKKWQGYLYYFLGALKKLENIETTVYRCVKSDLNEVQNNYKYAAKIHWSSFSSSTTDIQIAKQFGKILFIIHILNGKNIEKYSVFKGEKEILLNPNMSFVVSPHKPQFNDEGYWCIHLFQVADGDTYIF